MLFRCIILVHNRAAFSRGDIMNDVDQFFRLRARLVDLARTTNADPASIGVLSTGEACAVALLLGRLDLLDDHKHPLDAQVVQAATKWKRVALKRLGMEPGEGLITDMRAIRKDYFLDHDHSVYVASDPIHPSK